MTERCFSALKQIVTDYNGAMKPDIYFALSAIKLAVRFKRKYPSIE
jgi:hypothetical protein